jgi:Prolyl oligopeptidase, N-terminal beta-propeller domain
MRRRYPRRKKAPKVSVNGYKLVVWLRDKKNPEVKAYREAANAYADAVMESTESITRSQRARMESYTKTPPSPRRNAVSQAPELCGRFTSGLEARWITKSLFSKLGFRSESAENTGRSRIV